MREGWKGWEVDGNAFFLHRGMQDGRALTSTHTWELRLATPRCCHGLIVMDHAENITLRMKIALKMQS